MPELFAGEPIGRDVPVMCQLGTHSSQDKGEGWSVNLLINGAHAEQNNGPEKTEHEFRKSL